MGSILIPASKSLTVTDRLPDGNINEDIIITGRDGIYNYFSYLFFDISSIPSNVSISYAELVLFKTDKFYDDMNKTFGICPLLDYFSIYTTYSNRPRINDSVLKNFYPLTSKVAVTIILTSFVSSWVRNSCPNTGIMLFGKSKNILVKFGSSINQNSYLIPFLKVCFIPAAIKSICNKYYYYHYDNPLLKQVQVTGTVAADANYQAFVNIEVQRSGSGHKDNYYVADEYDNTSNNAPLHIDKTYTIPVVPRPSPGDTESTNVYGSYKESTL